MCGFLPCPALLSACVYSVPKRLSLSRRECWTPPRRGVYCGPMKAILRSVRAGRPRAVFAAIVWVLLFSLAGCGVVPAPRDVSLWDLLPGGYGGYGAFHAQQARPLVAELLNDWFPLASDRERVLDRIDRVAVALPFPPGESSSDGRDSNRASTRAAVAVVTGDFSPFLVNTQLRRMEGWDREETHVAGRRFRYWSAADGFDGEDLGVALLRGGHLLIVQGRMSDALAPIAGSAPAASLPTEARLAIDGAAAGIYVREPSLQLPNWFPGGRATVPIQELSVAARPLEEALWSLDGDVAVEGELNARVFTTLMRFLGRRVRMDALEESPGNDGGDNDGGDREGGAEATTDRELLPALSVERRETRIKVRGFIVPEALLADTLLNVLRLLGYS